jgi:hypothetical protein
MLALGVAPARATHLTTLSVGPPQTVAAGSTATFTGAVGTTADCFTATSYGFTLSAAGAPAGSTVTFTPSTAPANGPLSAPFTLTVAVPPGTAFGVSTITVTASFSAPGCVSGARTAQVTLRVGTVSAPPVVRPDDSVMYCSNIWQWVPDVATVTNPAIVGPGGSLTTRNVPAVAVRTDRLTTAGQAFFQRFGMQSDGGRYTFVCLPGAAGWLAAGVAATGRWTDQSNTDFPGGAPFNSTLGIYAVYG